MTEDTNRKKVIAGTAIAALVLGGGGVMLGRTVFAPIAATAPAEEGEQGEEENHGPEGFVEMDDARAKADAVSNEEMSKMSQGLPLPPGFKLPF